ncbi:GNAT family N-acetyltransferase [Aurantimonas sp. VKM B-3413]|uniref:GNAT family N-acetyltransferase n=1 Tax=Aurantimonas sp. VKM B-3413 TaxID=2779401 RepID=UPI001E4A0396|nr:GNAT family N-acetyltransferase [Aurantimonas sp. VKM B-3413]MCB8837095.1 GNAT family N-acetyltransferase [Aurantimonas sp. VKM B-3413]
MAGTIAVEAPLQKEVRAMVAAMNARMSAASSSHPGLKMTAEDLPGTETRVFMLRDGGDRIVGMGTLKRYGAGVGEVTRLFVEPEFRGSGLGRAVLTAIERTARVRGLHRLVLKTGSASEFAPARALYESAGFAPCCAVLDYSPCEDNRFYEKMLS